MERFHSNGQMDIPHKAEVNIFHSEDQIRISLKIRVKYNIVHFTPTSSVEFHLKLWWKSFALTVALEFYLELVWKTFILINRGELSGSFTVTVGALIPLLTDWAYVCTLFSISSSLSLRRLDGTYWRKMEMLDILHVLVSTTFPFGFSTDL